MGDFAGGFAEGFAQQQIDKDRRAFNEELKKIQVKLFKQKLDKQVQQQEALSELTSLIQGEPAIAPAEIGVPGPEQVGPTRPAVEGRSLMDVLSEPQGLSLLLRSGSDIGDIASLQQQQAVTQAIQGFSGDTPAAGPGFRPGLRIDARGPSLTLNPVKVRFVDTGTELVPRDEQGNPVQGVAPIPKDIEGRALDTPLSSNELSKFRNAEGNLPPVGSTPRDLKEGGFEAIVPDEQKAEVALRPALSVVDRLEELGEDIFSAESFGERLRRVPQLAADQLTQADANIALYTSTIEGTLAPIVKALGESGTLTDQDIKRVNGLLPKVFPVPDSREVAEQKFRQIREFLSAKLKKRSQGSRSDNVINFEDLPSRGR